MKRISVSLLSSLYTIVLYSQRYTGYGRGYDFDDANEVMNYKPSYWIFYIIAGLFVIGLPIVIYEKLKIWKGLKSGNYIKIVSNGYIVTTSSKNNEHLKVVKTWNLKEFEFTFGTFSYKTRKVNITHKNIEQITSTKGNLETIVYVPFECDYNDFFQRSKKFGIAKLNNGSFTLFKKG